MAAEHKPFLARLARVREHDEIISQSDAVRAMLDSPGWGLVQALVESTHGDAVNRLLFQHAGVEGKPLDQAEYARLLGFLSGLHQTRWAAEAFIEHAERVRRDDGR